MSILKISASSPPSSSSPTVPPPWISDKSKLAKDYTEPILNLCCKINLCYVVINQQIFTLLRAVLVEGKIEKGGKGVFSLTEEIILSRQQTNMVKIKHWNAELFETETSCVMITKSKKQQKVEKLKKDLMTAELG